VAPRGPRAGAVPAHRAVVDRGSTAGAGSGFAPGTPGTPGRFLGPE
jgi:hypothetical protein